MIGDKMQIKEVYKDIYQATFPLTGNPLKSINIFTIKSGDYALIIDTGFNNPENRANMEELFERLNLNPLKTKLFLTHLHSDHVGLAKWLSDKGVGDIYISEKDGKMVENGIKKEDFQWQNIIKNAHFQGLGPENLKIEDHPGYKNRPREAFPHTKIKPGWEISIGDYNFVAIDEEGHTPGMLGLYEKEHKILFCGDHILGKITPNITYWGDEFGDSLGIYLKNLKKIKDLDIKHLYSSHRFLVEDVNARIDELLDHHDRRLKDVLDIINKLEKANTTEITQQMQWDIKAKDWSSFPASQKWFAVAEAAAHLKHLVIQGRIKEEIVDGVGYYSIK